MIQIQLCPAADISSHPRPLSQALEHLPSSPPPSTVGGGQSSHQSPAQLWMVDVAGQLMVIDGGMPRTTVNEIWQRKCIVLRHQQKPHNRRQLQEQDWDSAFRPTLIAIHSHSKPRSVASLLPACHSRSQSASSLTAANCIFGPPARAQGAADARLSGLPGSRPSNATLASQLDGIQSTAEIP